MSMMEEFLASSTLFGGNMPFIEEQYERYLADPSSVDDSWRSYFDSLRGDARDVAHAPVIDSFIRLAKEGGGNRGSGMPRRPTPSIQAMRRRKRTSH